MVHPLAGSWLNLAGRTAIVTGSSSGIGRSVSESFFKQGCNVILADIKTNATSLNNPTQKKSFHSVECDITNKSQVKDLISIADDVANKYGISSMPLASILVNCAGITRDSFITKMDPDDFDKVLDINLRGTFLTNQYFCDPSRIDLFSSAQSTSSASIINIGSVVGSYGNIGQTNYAASKGEISISLKLGFLMNILKGGVVSFTKSLAKEMARYNIRVNAVCPGFIDTPMTKAVPNKVKEKMLQKIHLGRFGTPQDIADLVCFLSSERAKYITGQAIECSGLIEL